MGGSTLWRRSLTAWRSVCWGTATKPKRSRRRRWPGRSRRQREVVVLRYLADLPEREVATLLGTSVGSVKQHCHRAMSRLRLDLEATDA